MKLVTMSKFLAIGSGRSDPESLSDFFGAGRRSYAQLPRENYAPEGIVKTTYRLLRRVKAVNSGSQVINGWRPQYAM